MRLRRLAKRLPRAFRGGIGAAATVAFLAAAVGVPLPSGVRKDRSVAFPCMYRSCGCHDAAGCKDHCCCFSNQEKLAWAAEHHVDATPFADTRLLAVEDGLPRPSCAKCDSAETPSNDDGAACCANRPARQTSTIPRAGWLSIVAYRQCTGLAPLWTLLGAALPPPQVADCEHEWIVIGRVCEGDLTLTFTSFSPPTPPPRA